MGKDRFRGSTKWRSTAITPMMDSMPTSYEMMDSGGTSRRWAHLNGVLEDSFPNNSSRISKNYNNVRHSPDSQKGMQIVHEKSEYMERLARNLVKILSLIEDVGIIGSDECLTSINFRH